MKHKYFSAFLLLLLFIMQAELTAQEIPISGMTADWTTVLGGKALCRPVETSYGYAVLTDGKLICACTDRGVKLWERSIDGKSSPFLTEFSSDFLLTVVNKNTLLLVNPSGKVLWSKKLPYEITRPPVTGRDQRIFVSGNENTTCFGINGIPKWTIKTEPLAKSNLIELNDGSLLLFLKTAETEQSKALRISPFGEQLENITFSGTITAAYSVENGAFLCFRDGNGLCLVKNNRIVSAWKNTLSSGSSESYRGTPLFTELPGSKAAVLSGTGGTARISILSLKNGTEETSFSSPMYLTDQNDIQFARLSDKIFISGKEKAYVYTTSGTAERTFAFPKKNDALARWNQIFLSQRGTLLLCTDTWVMAGFKLSQSLSKKTDGKPFQTKKRTYISFYHPDETYFESTAFSDEIGKTITGEERKKLILEGNYGKDERDYVSALLTFEKAYRSYLMQKNSGARPDYKSVFEIDTIGVSELYSQLNTLGIDTFVNPLAFLIRNEKKDYLLAELLRSVAECGFDPEDSILSAIDARFPLINPSEKETLTALCDAVYEICRFMGRPAFYNHGISILMDFSNPKYPREIKDYARNTLSKIATLKI